MSDIKFEDIRKQVHEYLASLSPREMKALRLEFDLDKETEVSTSAPVVDHKKIHDEESRHLKRIARQLVAMKKQRKK